MSRKSNKSLPHPLNVPSIIRGCRSLCFTIVATAMLIGCNESSHDTRTNYIDPDICIPLDPHAPPICTRPIPLMHLFEEITENG